MDALRQLFAGFEAEQKKKMGNRKIFLDKRDLFDKYLKVDSDMIMRCLARDIKKSKKRVS